MPGMRERDLGRGQGVGRIHAELAQPVGLRELRVLGHQPRVVDRDAQADLLRHRSP